MNKKLIISLVIIVLVAAGTIVVLGSKDEMKSAATNQTPVISKDNNTPSSAPTQTNNSKVASGSYVNYSDGLIAKTKGTKVLFFHAPWCPQCNALETSIKDGTIPSGVTIIKVDYDSNQALRQKYGVTIQTTLVKVDDSGNKVKLYVAYDEPSLDSLKSNIL